MNKLQKNILALNECTKHVFCNSCPYDGTDANEDCINLMLSDSAKLLEEADRRLTTIAKMLTEWEMVDLRESLLREISLWEKAKIA